MKAAVVHDFDHPLSIDEVPVPEPSPPFIPGHVASSANPPTPTAANPRQRARGETT